MASRNAKKQFGKDIGAQAGRDMKAQVGIEYLVVTAFLLVVIGVFFAYALTSYSSAAASGKSQNIVDSLADSASQLSGHGNNSSMTIWLDFPEGIESFSVSGKNLLLNLKVNSGTTGFFAESKVNLSSIALGTSPGMHKVKISIMDGAVGFSEVH